MDREARPSLARVVGMVGITVYAVGDILGAGIYALVGQVVGLAGGASWASFLLAAAIAALTGLSYGEMVSRSPHAGGASSYCQHAFGRPLASFLVGFFVLMSGLTSAATVARAFVGYLDTFVTFPALVGSIGLLVLASALSYRGIGESTRVNLVMTAIEAGGLLLVIGAGLFAVLGGTHAGAGVELTHADLQGVLSGATVAFFAYIGFEDTVTIAEEVRDAERTIPRAIVIAIASTTAAYVGIVVLASMLVPAARLATSGTPLLDVLEAAGVHLPAGLFSFVALVAIANTGLLNLIMSSRMAYGMARQGLLPASLARVHAKRRTPWIAVLGAFIVAAAIAASGGAKVLAQTTSALLVVVFAVVHASVLAVRRRGDPAPAFSTPRWAPVAGIALCLALFVSFPIEVYARAALVLVVGLSLHAIRKRSAARAAPR